MERTNVLQRLANMIDAVRQPHPVRVAIDGVDASGKTTLANELADLLHHRNIIRASIDGFHWPRDVRHRLGRLSPEGYYRESFRIDDLIQCLLAPLSPGGNRMIRTRIFDYRRNEPIDEPATLAPERAILLLDGVFLLQEKLRPFWDLSIFVDCDFSITVPRSVERDTRENPLRRGHEAEVLEQYQQRYVPGQLLYFAEHHPQDHADILLHNNNIEHPTLTTHHS